MNLPFKVSKKLFSDGIWSLLGNLLTVAMGLAVVKATTIFVDPSEYGKVSLVLGVLALLNTFLVGPLMVAHLRVYFDYLKEGMAVWFSRKFNLVLIAAALAMLGIYLVIALLYYFVGQNVYLALLFPSALLIVAQPYLSTQTNYLEAHRLYRKLGTVNVLQKVFYLAGLLALLAASLSGSSAIILSQALSIIVILLITRVWSGKALIRGETQKEPDSASEGLSGLKKAFFSFGLALPLGYVFQWILTTGDRYLIEHFMSVKAVGIYAMNYGFWSMPYLVLNGWLEILTRPRLYRSASENNWSKVKQIIWLRAGLGAAVSLLGTLVFYFYGEKIAAVMLGAEYWGGWKLASTIAFAHCFYVLGYSVVPVFLSDKQAKPIFFATCIAAVTNIVGNIFLIKAYGIAGAAVSTLLSYCVWAGVLMTAAVIMLRAFKQNLPLPYLLFSRARTVGAVSSSLV